MPLLFCNKGVPGILFRILPGPFFLCFCTDGQGYLYCYGMLDFVDCEKMKGQGKEGREGNEIDPQPTNGLIA